MSRLVGAKPVSESGKDVSDLRPPLTAAPAAAISARTSSVPAWSRSRGQRTWKSAAATAFADPGARM